MRITDSSEMEGWNCSRTSHWSTSKLSLLVLFSHGFIDWNSDEKIFPQQSLFCTPKPHAIAYNTLFMLLAFSFLQNLILKSKIPNVSFSLFLEISKAVFCLPKCPLLSAWLLPIEWVFKSHWIGYCHCHLVLQNLTQASWLGFWAWWDTYCEDSSRCTYSLPILRKHRAIFRHWRKN